MIDGDCLEIEKKWCDLTGNPLTTREHYDGTFLEDDEGIIYRLRDGFNISEYEIEYRSKQDELKKRIANDNISKENADTLFSLLEKEKQAHLKKKHKTTLPKDGVLVVRTQAIKAFEQIISEPDKKKTAEPHGNAERFATNREEILGAAVSVLARWFDDCKNGSGKIEATKIRELIENKSYFFWREDGEPPLSTREIENLIRKWLKKSDE